MVNPVTDTQDVVPVDASRLVAVASQFGIATDDLNELARIGADAINRAMFEITRAGLAFLRAQELMSLGKGRPADGDSANGFIEWIDSQGISKVRVYESMRIARFVVSLPPKQMNNVLALGKTKVMLLAALSEDVIKQAEESGDDLIAKADVMTIAELKEEIRSFQRREENYDKEIERLETKVKTLSAARVRTTQFTLRTEEIREECMALQLGGECHLNSLRKLFDSIEHLAPEGMLQLEHVWIAAHVLASRALDLIDHLQAHAPAEGMPERIHQRHLLQPEEAQRWLLDYPLIENRHATEAALREMTRQTARERRESGKKKKARG